MKDVIAAKAGTTARQLDRSAALHREREPLDRRYGKIGISAVAAAARYASSAGAAGGAQESSRQKPEG